MKIKNVKISNFKSFGQEGIEIDNIENLNFFIGKNNGGKTNILKALKYFFDNFSINPVYNTIDDYNRQIFSKLDDDTTLSIEISIEFNDKELDLMFFNEKEKIITITNMHDKMLNFSFEIKKKNNNYVQGITSIKTGGKVFIYSLGNVNSSYFDFEYNRISYGGTPNNRFTLFSNALSTILRNKFILIPSVRKINTDYYKGGKLEHDCSNLNSVLHDFVNTKGSKIRIKDIEQTCKQILSFRDFIISNPIDGQVFTYVDEDDVNLRLDGYGAGTEGILKIITLIKTYPDHIFGVEEPEVHIHPEVQRALLDFFKNHFKDNHQVFITTHSSIFTSKNGNSKTFLVTKNSDKKTKVSQIKNKGEFINIKHELGHKNIDLFFYDMVLFIEGDSEEKAFPIIASAMGIDLDVLGIKIVNIQGKDRLNKIRDFIRYIKDSDVKKFIILDNNKDDTNTFIGDLVRAGLLSEEEYHVWSKGDFEDCFNEEDVIKAMQSIKGSDFDLSVSELKEKRKFKSTANIIEEKLYEKKLGPLNKPDLAEELATIIQTKLLKFGKDMEKTEIEEVIAKIVRKLNI